jgi:type II secretory pathway component HofQ
VIVRALLLAAAIGTTAAASAATAKRSVTLDVKDADVRVILKSMQQQCGIRNLLIDKEVSGNGTLLFRDVPCATAFKVVFQQFGLAGQVARNVTTVERREH